TTPALEATFDALGFGPGPNQFFFKISDNGASVATNISNVTLDGTDVTSSVTSSKSGSITTGTYTQVPFFTPGSRHIVNVSWQTTLGQTLTITNQILNVPNYAVVPPSLAVTGVDTTQPGFRLLPWQSAGEPNRVY